MAASPVQLAEGDMLPTTEKEPVFRFSASLRIMEAGHLHDEISRKTGIAPTQSHQAGDLAFPGTKITKVRKQSLWCLSSPLDRSLELTAHLEWLWEKISLYADYFRSLVEGGIRMDVFCGYRANSDTAGFSIKPRALRIVHELQIPLEVSVIIYDLD